MFLPDINLWLALAFESHVHHTAARDWFEGSSNEPCSFCRLTQQGFLRLATNPKAFGAEAVTLAEAWRLYDAFLGDPRIAFATEPEGLETLWRGYTQGPSFTPQVWSDAYLAAFARASGLELITFDKGFSRYMDLRLTILS
jgi:toxin-antitoxin system PIN domain toxin